MRELTTVALLLFIVCSTSGCYNAQVITGQPPSNEVVEEKWLLGFVYGLVIPDEINVEDECPNGVARVETKLSFMNQVASFLTAGIFTPMHVTVTCAASFNSAAALDVVEGNDSIAAIQEAASRSLKEERPIYVHLAP